MKPTLVAGDSTWKKSVVRIAALNLWSILFAAAAWLALSGRADALQYRFEEENVPANDAAAIDLFLEKARSAFPSGAQAMINKPLRVRFADIDGSKELGSLCPDDDWAAYYGRSKAKPARLGELRMPLWPGGDYEILIHQGFRKIVLAGSGNATDCPSAGHQTLYDLAVAAVIHETAHVIDRGGTYSGSKQYMNLTDWASGALGAPGLNVLFARSPNNYEFKNPAESFAVNFEYFALDPEFACRRPALWRYLTAQFGTNSTAADCAPYFNYSVLLANGQRREIDPKKVYEVDYLFAAPGETIASWMGHGMFRLVLCGDHPFGPKCRGDISANVAVGYRANADWNPADSVFQKLALGWKAIWGSLPSNVYFYSLPTVLQEYSEDESRDVVSLPLALTQEQKEMFAEHLLEQYWGYEGPYYFLWNNCSTEGSKAIGAALNSEHSFQGNSTQAPFGSPKTLYRDLVSRGLIDPRLLVPRSEAVRKGYLFPSHREHLEEAFDLLKQKRAAMGDFEDQSVHQFLKMYPSYQEFIEESTAMERRKFIAPKDAELTAAIFTFEKHSANALMEKISKLGANVQGRNDPSADGAGRDMKSAVENLETLKPWKQIEGAGYGIPRKSEMIGEPQIAQYQTVFKGAVQRLQMRIESLAPDLYRELLTSRQNLWLLQRAMMPDNLEIASNEAINKDVRRKQ